MGASESSGTFAESTNHLLNHKDQSNKERNIMGYIREAYHAGSWYEASKEHLDQTLSSFLLKAREADMDENKRNSEGVPRAIISPHAGFSYSGATAAFAYRELGEALSKTSIKSIVVLHPSHHVRLDGCALSGASAIETPLLNLRVETELRKEMLENGHFSVMEKQVDENEHSGEMQYPFIAKMLIESGRAANTVGVLPIMVGGINVDKESFFGEVMSPFLARTDVFTVISSDFCHWGTRFGYYPPHDKDYKALVEEREFSKGAKTLSISEYISELDHIGMDHIQMQNPGAFAEYIKKSHNTICGRHPIAVWLRANKASKSPLEVTFVKYAQSSAVRSIRESSVSYASAVAWAASTT